MTVGVQSVGPDISMTDYVLEDLVGLLVRIGNPALGIFVLGR